MRRILLLTVSLFLVIAACSGTTVEESVESPAGEDSGAGSQEGATAEASPSESSEPSSEASSPGETTATAAPTAAPEGPAAPDFTLALEPGGEFVLSQEVKPVFMVFWAEW